MYSFKIEPPPGWCAIVHNRLPTFSPSTEIATILSNFTVSGVFYSDGEFTDIKIIAMEKKTYLRSTLALALV